MSKLLGLGRLPTGLALLASAGLLATGCGGKTGCGSGAESGEDAVRQFLGAAARDDSDEDVCRYLQEGENVDEAVTWVSGLGTAGDVDALDVREARGDQMGAAHRFVLGPSSAPIADLTVIERDGRFVVSVTGSTKK